MKELLIQVLQNLRANKLRSFLTMFGILWGVISVVILSATGEGFQRGNQTGARGAGQEHRHRLGRPHIAAGGRRACRPADLAHRRRCAGAGRRIAHDRGGQPGAPARRHAASRAPSTRRRSNVHGIEPQYQAIRTIDIERGRMFRLHDEEQARRVAIIGADADGAALRHARQPRPARLLNGLPYTVDRQDPEEGSGQQLQRARQRQGVRAVLGHGARLSAHRRRARRRVATSSSRRSRGWSTRLPRVLDARTGRIEDIDWPLEREVRRVLARAAPASIPTTATPSRCGTRRSRR